jgi:DNA invertase Pin-like site-specific DNA recombinase
VDAAIYARISLDRDRDGAGVARQVADATALADARGWTVVERFTDNDRSAYNGRVRPGWNALLDALQSGTIMTVVAWANDRLYRRTRDQLDLMEAVRASGGVISTVKEGDIDPGSAEGRMRMGVLANVAEFESARKAERVARAAEQRAALGRPHGRPPFGWRADVTGEWIIDSEPAALIREAAHRVLRGESCGSIVEDWDTRRIPTPAGAPRWTHQTLRKLLRRASNASLRVHRDAVVGRATWPAILDTDTWEMVVSRLRAPDAHRRPRSYLLTGRVTCRVDGGRMTGHRQARPQYQCMTCGRVIAADMLDELVTEKVLRWAAQPRLGALLARARSGSRSEAAAMRALDQADRRLAEIAAMFGRGDLDASEYRSARTAAQARRAEAERKLSGDRSSRVLAEALVSVDSLRDDWASRSPTWRREFIAAMVKEVIVGPPTKVATWEPDRVRVIPLLTRQT